MKKEKGIIKEFLSYKRAKDLMNEISKIIDAFWDVKIVEEKAFGRTEKKLIVKIDRVWWDAEKFSKLIDLLFKEAVKYNLWVHGSYYKNSGDLEIRVNLK